MRRSRVLPLLAVLLLAASSCGTGTPLPLTVRIGIDRYTPAMSSVPGLPIEVSSVEGASVLVTCDDGSLSLWGAATDSRVVAKGRSYEGRTPVTVYWSPYSGEDAAVDAWPDKAAIEVTATMATPRRTPARLPTAPTIRPSRVKSRLISLAVIP